MSVFVIGEIAACHDGDLDKALQLVAMVAGVGCDAVKTQWCSNPAKLAQRRRAPEYLESYKLLDFPLAWHGALSEAAAAHNIEYMTTVYLAEDIAVVAPYVSRFKVASFEAGDVAFVTAHVDYKKDILVSLGMGQEPPRELGDYLNAYRFLHCISAYPAPLEDMNLRLLRNIPRYEYRWGYSGLSDHSKHPWTGALAVAAGATIIEFHVRLSSTSPTNADYEVARTPEEAEIYIQNVRLAEVMLGTGERKIQPSEADFVRYKVKP